MFYFERGAKPSEEEMIMRLVVQMPNKFWPYGLYIFYSTTGDKQFVTRFLLCWQ